MNNKPKVNQRLEGELQWEREHDEHLLHLMTKHGNGEWKLIANCMCNRFPFSPRTPKDCYNRWKLLSGKKESWSDKERYLLLTAHQKYNNRWAEVAPLLRKQSRNFIKNRFYTLFRKVRNRIKNSDVQVTSLLDLLEVYYITSLIEQYCKLPNGKRTSEKNYARKLVQRMDEETVTQYKELLKKLYKDKGTMEDLFNICGIIYCSQEKTKDNVKINLNAVEEGRIKIVLPQPNDFFVNTEMMTTEEKNNFWKNAFGNKESMTVQSAKNTERASHSTGTYTGSSRVFQTLQTESVGWKCENAMRDDECFEFSQFISYLEPETRHNTMLSNFLLLPSINPHSGRPFYSTLNSECEFLAPTQLMIPVTITAAELAKDDKSSALLKIKTQMTKENL